MLIRVEVLNTEGLGPINERTSCGEPWELYHGETARLNSNNKGRSPDLTKVRTCSLQTLREECESCDSLHLSHVCFQACCFAWVCALSLCTAELRFGCKV